MKVQGGHYSRQMHFNSVGKGHYQSSSRYNHKTVRNEHKLEKKILDQGKQNKIAKEESLGKLEKDFTYSPDAAQMRKDTLGLVCICMMNQLQMQG
jgi:hypothetical protein